MKNFIFPLIIWAVAVALPACNRKFASPPPPTLAQICSDSFPCGDTLIFVEVEVPVEVPGFDTVFSHILDTAFLAGDTVLVPVSVPGHRTVIIRRVMVPAQIDSALRVAYEQLGEAYQKSIADLRACQAAKKNKPTGGRGYGLSYWLIVAALLAVILWRARWR